MANDPDSAPSRTNISLVVGVLIAVVSSLLLAMLDSLQTRAEPTSVASFTGAQAAVTIVLAPTDLPSATPIPVTAEVVVLALAAEASPTVQSMRPTCGRIPGSWIPYVVLPGDTVFALALSSGATTDEIVQANCLELDTLISGIEIYLPDTPPIRSPCGVPPEWALYTVQKGDTLYSLARSRDTTIYEVMQANCLENSILSVGQPLYLPPLSVIITATATAALLPTPTSPPPPEPTEKPSATAVPTATTQVTATSPVSDTPTPPAPTATPSSTATPGPTASSTATEAPSPSPTSTNTPAATATSSATATASATLSATDTSTPTVTSTATLTPTPTSTATPSDTATPTETATPTATAAPDAP